MLISIHSLSTPLWFSERLQLKKNKQWVTLDGHYSRYALIQETNDKQAVTQVILTPVTKTVCENTKTQHELVVMSFCVYRPLLPYGYLQSSNPSPSD